MKPTEINNPHLKAHADERRLFSEATASAAHESSIKFFLLRTRNPIVDVSKNRHIIREN